ncbi:MAG: Mur ligase family protein [Alphaproteobacteria bacterium]|jgi:UDP-N-acetylmuramate--alanine ligase|nr:Mur ligase family protein [Alphaproteobacteria bacterium]
MTNKTYFFCAVGGSGMLPLALAMKARDCDVRGSDRSYDQGRTPDRFAFIQQQGITLFPQDGSGITPDLDGVIASTAVEETVSDIRRAKELQIPVIPRAKMLADIVNSAKVSIGVAGTSGKSTTTGMTGWILHKLGANPTIINGASMKNFASAAQPVASAHIGNPDLIVAEVDESDGSIANYTPTIALINNIALDHKAMEELRALFEGYAARASKVIINLDNGETRHLAAALPADKRVTFSLTQPDATFYASNIKQSGMQSQAMICYAKTNDVAPLTLPMPGQHNIANALAAIAAAVTQGCDFKQAVQALESFAGMSRRMDVVGIQRGVTVIDDFAHNPDKITASLKTLDQLRKETKGRLLILFQPHGYGPLKLMRHELVEAFAGGMGGNDQLFLCDPLYLGGTTDKSIGSLDLAQDLADKGHIALYNPSRDHAAQSMVNMAKEGDILVIMGARDDTLPLLARHILIDLSNPVGQ